ncbi:hypothetical protein [Phyllobacterium sp.]|uniref:hypothetical protein n=1 Tax=Phyllobacterium sp. TaxID=1871046 RepID=UPI0030F43B48
MYKSTGFTNADMSIGKRGIERGGKEKAIRDVRMVDIVRSRLFSILGRSAGIIVAPEQAPAREQNAAAAHISSEQLNWCKSANRAARQSRGSRARWVSQ